MNRITAAVLLSLALAACGDSSPGPLAGTWQAGGMLPHKSTFRSGEIESDGMIEHVVYEVQGQSVIVTYKDGFMKGTALRYVFVDPNTVKVLDTTYRRLSN